MKVVHVFVYVFNIHLPSLLVNFIICETKVGND